MALRCVCTGWRQHRKRSAQTADVCFLNRCLFPQSCRLDDAVEAGLSEAARCPHVPPPQCMAVSRSCFHKALELPNLLMTMASLKACLRMQSHPRS